MRWQLQKAKERTYADAEFKKLAEAVTDHYSRYRAEINILISSII